MNLSWISSRCARLEWARSDLRSVMTRFLVPTTAPCGCWLGGGGEVLNIRVHQTTDVCIHLHTSRHRQSHATDRHAP